MLMPCLTASHQRLTALLLVTALLLLQLSTALHQPLAHIDLTDQQGMPSVSPTPDVLSTHQHVHSQEHHTAERHNPPLSTESQAPSSHHGEQRHSHSHEGGSTHVVEHNSADHSHQSIYLSGSGLMLPEGVAAAQYDYRRTHRSPANTDWLRPPRAGLAT